MRQAVLACVVMILSLITGCNVDDMLTGSTLGAARQEIKNQSVVTVQIYRITAQGELILKSIDKKSSLVPGEGALYRMPNRECSLTRNARIRLFALGDNGEEDSYIAYCDYDYRDSLTDIWYVRVRRAFFGKKGEILRETLTESEEILAKLRAEGDEETLLGDAVIQRLREAKGF